MAKEECLINRLIGTGKAGRRDRRIFAYAVERERWMIFHEGIAAEDILVTKSIYPEAGKRYGKTGRTAGRQIERLCNICWEEMDKGQREKYFGESECRPAPREIILYLAYYCHFQKSYKEVENERYEEMYSKGIS